METRRKGRRQVDSGAKVDAGDNNISGATVETVDDAIALADTDEHLVVSVGDALRHQISSRVNTSQLGLVAKHVFPLGQILYETGVEKNGKYQIVYLPISEVTEELIDQSTNATEIGEFGDTSLGLDSVEEILDNFVNPESYKLPFSLFVREAIGTNRLLRFDLFAVNENGFVLHDGTSLSLEDIDNLYASKKISQVLYGLLYYLYIKSKDPDLGDLLTRSISLNENLEVEKCEFGIREHEDFQQYNAKEGYVYSKSRTFWLMSRIYAIPYLYERFKLNLAVDSSRMILSPFESRSKLESSFDDGSIALLSQIQSRGHSCHDVILYDGGNSGMVFDGVSGAGAVLPAIELMTSGRGNNLREWDALVTNGIGEHADLRHIFATFSSFVFDPNSRMLDLATCGDAIGIHLNSDLDVVQVCGGASAGYFELSKKQDVTDEEITEFFNESYITEGGVTIAGLKSGESTSSAIAKSGDIVIIATDFLDKVFGLESNFLDVFTNDYPDDIAFLRSGFKKENRGRFGTNIDRNVMYGITVRLFIRYIQKLKKEGIINNFEELKGFIKTFYSTELDDSAIVVKQIQV